VLEPSLGKVRRLGAEARYAYPSPPYSRMRATALTLTTLQNPSVTSCQSVMQIFGEICLSTPSKLGPNVGEATNSFVCFVSSSLICLAIRGPLKVTDCTGILKLLVCFFPIIFPMA
jgi:hypothetical protein